MGVMVQIIQAQAEDRKALQVDQFLYRLPFNAMGAFIPAKGSGFNEATKLL